MPTANTSERCPCSFLCQGASQAEHCCQVRRGDWKRYESNSQSPSRSKPAGDYYRAAMILQHGDVAEDYLLAHEFCVVAISKGDARAKWLAAASEDRFLMNIDRPQRFATQFRCDGLPNCEYHLYKLDTGV